MAGEGEEVQSDLVGEQATKLEPLPENPEIRTAEISIFVTSDNTLYFGNRTRALQHEEVLREARGGG